MATRSLILLTLLVALHTFPRGADCVSRCTGLDDFTGNLIFAGQRDYCTMQLDYMECNFDCIRKPVVVGKDYPSVHPMLLESAVRVHIPPVCVSWVTVRHSARVATVRGSSDNQHCGYWLRLENSEAVSLDYGIVDLSAKDSDIGYINLPRLRQLNIYNSSVRSIDHAEIIMYPSSISKSRIKDIFFINVTVADLKITDTVIDTIGPGSITFNGENLIFENVSIRRLKNRAITMLSGKLIMKNCSIDDVAMNAIVADDSKVIFSEVMFGKIESPAFHFDSGSEISVTKVTVGGQPFRSFSKYIGHPPVSEVVGSEEVVITGFSTEYCEFVLGTLLCDFTGVNKPVVFEKNSLPLQLTINISNANVLRAVGDFSCAHINIINCTGKFISLASSTCSSVGKLSVTRSNLTAISSKMASHITINWSSVTALQATSVNSLEVAHSTIRSVHDVLVEREVAWSRSHLLQVSSLKLKGSGRIRDCKFDTISSTELTIGQNAITFSNTSIKSLPQKHSIWVKSGVLSLENVTVSEATPASVFLEEEASLTLNNVSFDLLVFGTISVSRLQQVSFDGAEGTDYAFLTQRRAPVEGEGSWVVPLGAYTADVDQPYCSVATLRLVCDYTTVPDAVVVVVSNVSEVALKRPTSVIIRPTRTQFVAVSEVTSLSVAQQQSDAELSVLAVNSNFINLTAVVHSFILDNSSVDSFFMPPDHTMMSLTARNCEIRELVVLTQLAFFILSKIGNIHLLTGDSVLIKNSSIHKISPAGLVVRRDGFIDSTTIDYLGEKSIVIHGKFTAKNTSISKAVENSIVVGESGSVILQNVTMEHSAKCPFLILGKIDYVSDLRINGLHINSASSFLQYCGVDGVSHLGTKSSEWDDEINGNKRKFWLGLAVGALVSLFLAATILLVIRSCRPGRPFLMPLVSWRSSSETIVYSGLKQNEPPLQEPAESPPEEDSEKSRLVKEDEQ